MKTQQATLSEKLRFQIHKVELKAMGLILNAMKMRDTKVFSGTESIDLLANEMVQSNCKKALIITTPGAIKRGYTDKVILSLTSRNIESAIYDGITPDPTFSVVEKSLTIQQQYKSDCIIALGGGSVIDAAKALAIAATNDKPVSKLTGIRKGKNKPLPLYAIPTTSGTASEVTPAAVISEDATHTKRFIIDSRTIALSAALDPTLSASLPPSITAETGMDALTHSIEAYISKLSSHKTDAIALDAIKQIFEHLPIVYKDGSNLTSREAMANASLKAGKAFRKAPLGYVHAISHQLGALYGLPHGLGNAIVLPKIVEYSKDAVTKKLATLATELDLGAPTEAPHQLAEKFITALQKLNHNLDIPSHIEKLSHNDIPVIASRAYTEALEIHAAPKYMGKKAIENLLLELG